MSVFAGFLERLRGAGLPVSVTEYLTLLGAMKRNVAGYNVDDFYYLARATLVKDERLLDRFDRVFGEVFQGLEALPGGIEADMPEAWLRKLAETTLTPEEMAQIASLGGLEKLMQTLRERLAEQKERHAGGNTWIGTAGTSPFGAHGYNPEAVRIGQGESRHRRAVKVWDKRDFRDLDGDVELGTRSMKLALRRLRRFARQGAATELDLPGTIHATASNAGSLDLKLRPERHNAVKILLLLDIGGSMDDHVRASEELFSAARSEFKHFAHFYFHNCIYEHVWRENRRRAQTALDTWQLLRTYGPDYKLVFVGDATMSPYEIIAPGGSVEHVNAEPGQLWLSRLLGHFRSAAWLNPIAERFWPGTHSIHLVRTLLADRMYPLTLSGLDQMARDLSR